MNFRKLSKIELSYWDEFVDNSPEGSIYAKSFYLISKGCDFSINIIERNKTILGGIVLCRNELGVYSNPLFVKYLGVFYADEKILGPSSKRRKYKIDRILLSNIKTNFIFSYDFHPNYNNWMSFYWDSYFQTTKYTYQIFFNNSNFRENYTSKVLGPLKKLKTLILK